ncbi:hypothetical protein PUN28_005879 [Cardiocondyla obscurior]|uniref:Uncharacterized protein n=1 Tax=Cardiocondyla obscurior TaxID=286306 RepID=A0AAW2G7R4_9HYME
MDCSLYIHPLVISRMHLTKLLITAPGGRIGKIVLASIAESCTSNLSAFVTYMRNSCERATICPRRCFWRSACFGIFFRHFCDRITTRDTTGKCNEMKFLIANAPLDYACNNGCVLPRNRAVKSVNYSSRLNKRAHNRALLSPRLLAQSRTYPERLSSLTTETDRPTSYTPTGTQVHTSLKRFTTNSQNTTVLPAASRVLLASPASVGF